MSNNLQGEEAEVASEEEDGTGVAEEGFDVEEEEACRNWSIRRLFCWHNKSMSLRCSCCCCSMRESVSPKASLAVRFFLIVEVVLEFLEGLRILSALEMTFKGSEVTSWLLKETDTRNRESSCWLVST